MVLRPLGDIISDMEGLLDEMLVDHDLEMGNVLSIIHNFIQVHYPDSIETYTDGTKPEFYYGPKE